MRGGMTKRLWIIVLVLWIAATASFRAFGAGPVGAEERSQTQEPVQQMYPDGETRAQTPAGGGTNEQESADEALLAEVLEDAMDDLNLDEIQQFLDATLGRSAGTYSFRELMQLLMEGEFMAVFERGAAMLRSELFTELSANRKFMGQILVLAMVGAAFSGFSGIFGSGHVSETGFYVVYLLIMTFLAASFFASVTIASDVLASLLRFMQVVLPAYFLAVAAAGGALTSAAVCGFTLGAVGVVQSVCSGLLVPLIRVYMMMVLAGNLYKEDMLSRFTDLLGHGIRWAVKTMFGLIVGFHLIQGLILPQVDALKNASAMRFLQVIPGVGAGAGAVTQVVMGSGILIKNAVGVAAMVILALLAAVPMIKMAVLMALYYLAAAVMQPVCDKRLVACMTGVAAGHGLLLKVVGYALALFAVTLAVLCASTNAVWYAG